MPLPHTFFTILLILDILVLAVLIPYGHLHHQDPGYFMREGKTITHLSAVQLGAIGLLSLLILNSAGLSRASLHSSGWPSGPGLFF